jgi:hypothetical protein
MGVVVVVYYSEEVVAEKSSEEAEEPYRTNWAADFDAGRDEDDHADADVLHIAEDCYYVTLLVAGVEVERMRHWSSCMEALKLEMVASCSLELQGTCKVVENGSLVALLVVA